MLTIENLQVKYGSQIALAVREPIQFNPGDRIGIIGSNGAGKTTLVKAVLGLINYSGTIRTSLKPAQIAAHMQQNNYVLTMPTRIIFEAILNTPIHANPRLQELLAFFDFEKCLNKSFGKLSGGEKQRMTMILVLLQDAPLTFYDEVTSSLDFETRQRLMDKMYAWYAGKTETICIVSHYYDELERLVDQLLILEKGEVAAFGNKDALFQQYCGRAIITLENNAKNRDLTATLPRIEAPEHLIALKCEDESEEIALSARLIQSNVDFKRSNSDIEILFINALAQFHRKHGGDQ